MSEKVMQYVGARYVPKFADPIEWQENTAYEALTVVMYNNSSYTSKIPVPANVGIPATNDKYWALTGNYNGQIEEYRQETAEVKNKQSELDTKVDQKTTELGTKIDQEISDRSALIYNNNGKADVSLGLSVEGKLSANDGIDISGNATLNGLNLRAVSNRKFILIGDSYSVGVDGNNSGPYSFVEGGGWATRFKNKYNPYLETFTPESLNCYHPDLSWDREYSPLSTLKEMISKNAFKNDSISDIVVFCGTNSTDSSQITNKVNEFVTFVHENFKNAFIQIGYIGAFPVSRKTIITEMKKSNAYFNESVTWIYTPYNYIGSDGTHLTKEGYEFLQKYVEQSILFGHSSYTFKYFHYDSNMFADYPGVNLNSEETVTEKGYSLEVKFNDIGGSVYSFDGENVPMPVDLIAEFKLTSNWIPIKSSMKSGFREHPTARSTMNAKCFNSGALKWMASSFFTYNAANTLTWEVEHVIGTASEGDTVNTGWTTPSNVIY